jgi:hypothetical protein
MLADDEESNQCFLGGLIIRNLSIWLDFFSFGFVIFGILKEAPPPYLLKCIFLLQYFQLAMQRNT